MLENKMYFEDLICKLDSLIIYKNIKNNIVIQNLYKLFDCIAFFKEEKGITTKYYSFIRSLVESAEKSCISGDIFKKHIINLMLDDENIFSLACERNEDILDKSLYKFILKELQTIMFVMSIDIENIIKNIGNNEEVFDYIPINNIENKYINTIQQSTTKEDMAKHLVNYYKTFGASNMAKYKMFKYDSESGIIGIENYDNIYFSDIIGYDYQKTAIKNNTEAFLNGLAANNVLLAGSRGTGKSSCVKALANTYFEKGLRIIEVSSFQLLNLPKLLNYLSNRGKYFIIFIDDLSFEDFEVEYKNLKSVLEGGVEARPKNVLFYATSNRRHIIQEKWSDKKINVDSEEIHTSDSVNEKLSLSDRFGLTINFNKPTPNEYINIVMAIAKKENINISDEFLKAQAFKWELNQKDFSGRTAKQFINNVIWELYAANNI